MTRERHHGLIGEVRRFLLGDVRENLLSVVAGATIESPAFSIRVCFFSAASLFFFFFGIFCFADKKLTDRFNAPMSLKSCYPSQVSVVQQRLDSIILLPFSCHDCIFKTDLRNVAFSLFCEIVYCCISEWAIREAPSANAD